jgi:4-hydroxybenzoate polyprenyltransferase
VVKPAYQSTEFWLVPAAWAAMEASPEIAWPVAIAYVAFALGRSVVKALSGQEVQL